MPPGGNQKKEKPRQRNKNKLRNQRAEGIRLEETTEDENTPKSTRQVILQSNASWSFPGMMFFPQGSRRPLIDNDSQISTERVLNTGDVMDQVARKWRQATMSPQPVSGRKLVPHEYSQEALGLSSEERRTQIRAELPVSREAWTQKPRTEQVEKGVARDEREHLVAGISSTDPLYQYNAGDDGSVERPRRQRYRDLKKGCDRMYRAKPYLRCKYAGIGAGYCVEWRPHDRKDRHCQKNIIRA
ncbi:uncharacterized protein M421DRAFT_134392 [Didymella exigua CBS 183.55]|uniref:Uncharacterized protein n=1 Tax=Didymella exigua CBS 183.55 TaxID=1150837 RepID=A0A6A5RNH2_9PLEO|nr:uncharacterized protein M421DRAFT_134392 [Didymella exigua CBS 183.55]KAF1929199.1 hypothetical protein M421DRAFT_134392 [Didymella exigua CBS 183.55]